MQTRNCIPPKPDCKRDLAIRVTSVPNTFFMATTLLLIALALLAGLASTPSSQAAGKLTFDSTPAVMTSHIVAECSFTKSKRFRTTLSLNFQDPESGVVDWGQWCQIIALLSRHIQKIMVKCRITVKRTVATL